MTQGRAILMIAALFALAPLGLALAADPNPKATLSCELVDGGQRTKLPANGLRLEAPVECQISVAGPARAEAFAARLVTTWTDYAGSKPVRKKSERLTGKVNAGAPWTGTLAPDQDFVGCLNEYRKINQIRKLGPCGVHPV